jgi:hypothetical protein
MVNIAFSFISEPPVLTHPSNATMAKAAMQATTSASAEIMPDRQEFLRQACLKEALLKTNIPRR